MTIIEKTAGGATIKTTRVGDYYVQNADYVHVDCPTFEDLLAEKVSITHYYSSTTQSLEVEYLSAGAVYELTDYFDVTAQSVIISIDGEEADSTKAIGDTITVSANILIEYKLAF